MVFEQTVTIPADHRVSLEFLAPKEIPAGPAWVELKVIPLTEKQDNLTESRINKEPSSENIKEQPTPITNSLTGILAHLGDINPKEIREGRLSKYLK